MTDVRDRLLSLLSESSAYGTGAAIERERLSDLICARLSELAGDETSAGLARQDELKHLLQRLNDATS